MSLSCTDFCVGFFHFIIASFYASGCSSIDEAVTSTREWGHQHRKKLDELLNVEDRVDKDHPEMVTVRNMTEEEEYNYVSQRYFSQHDQEEENESDDKQLRKQIQKDK